MDAGPHAEPAQLLLEPADVAGDLRADVGVEADGREALVLPVLRQHLGRDGQERLWELLADDLGDALLVLRVQEGEQEAHRDRLDARLLQLADLLARLLVVERDEHRAVLRDALGHREAIATPDDRIALPRQVLVVREVEGLLVARDVEDVAIALGRDHPDRGAVVLDHDVRRDRRAVEHLVERGRALPRLLRDLDDALDGAERGVRGSGRKLVDPDLPGLVVDVDQVGERPSDVDTHTFHLPTPLPYGVRTSLPKCSRLSIVSMASFASASGNVA